MTTPQDPGLPPSLQEINLNTDAPTRDNILITSGSLQGLDLVNGILTSPGDTVLIEQECYQGSITRLVRRGINIVGIPLDKDGMRIDAVAEARQQRGVQCEPGAERERPVQVTAVLSHLGDGGVAPDHRHDSFVQVAKRLFWLSSY